MPDLLVSAATGALVPVLNMLAALLSDEYKRFIGVRGEVKFLIRELEAMHVFLVKKSEDENPDAQDKAWMKEVRELSYDIEDSLDEFRVRIDDESIKPDGFIDKCKNLLDKTKTRHHIAKAIQDLKIQVEEVSERNARYKQIGERNASNKTVDQRALAIFEDASRLVGINKPKQEVISFLMKEDGGILSQQPKIVSIVGIGGIGKTTLANRVYEELKDKFQCRAFLSVSRNPDIFNILKTILSELTGQRYYETEAGSTQQLIMKISEFLQTKRYLVVVDDVWDVQTWGILKHALSNNSCGSVIITTTRKHDVAEACRSLYSDGWVYQPKPLEEHDSKRLFQNRIFGPGNECPQNLQEVTNKITKKCAGLPLAIIAVSGLLASKARNRVHSVTEWDKLQTSFGHGLERNATVDGMMEILSLSYFDLPYYLKACLLYLSAFPEDSFIDKKQLILLWVAEGFIPAESTCTMYESGEKSFITLINRNLIFPRRIDPWTGEVSGCGVHDKILDFVVHKSVEDNFVTVHGLPRLTPTREERIKIRRQSLQIKSEGHVTLDSNLNYANVRSVISFGSSCSLLGIRFLRVLDFFRYPCFRSEHLDSIGELLQLRYLGLRSIYQPICLPEKIGKLQYLETLDLRNTFSIRFPTTIVRLKRLVNLLMSTYGLKNFPREISALQALEELNTALFDIKEAANCVKEIGKLTKMRDLGIKLYFDSDIDEARNMEFLKNMVSSVQRLNNLQTLSLEFRNKERDYIFVGDYIELEEPVCATSLRNLVFKIVPLSRVPSWMKSLVNIEQLGLRVNEFDQESLCILGCLPALVVLRLDIESTVEDMPFAGKEQLVDTQA